MERASSELSTTVESRASHAYRKLRFLRRELAGATLEVKINAYKVLIRAGLEYGSIIWDPYLQIGINQIERIQRIAARFIYSKYSRHESVSRLLTMANLPSLA